MTIKQFHSSELNWTELNRLLLLLLLMYCQQFCVECGVKGRADDRVRVSESSSGLIFWCIGKYLKNLIHSFSIVMNSLFSCLTKFQSNFNLNVSLKYVLVYVWVELNEIKKMNKKEYPANETGWYSNQSISNIRNLINRYVHFIDFTSCARDSSIAKFFPIQFFIELARV